MSTEGAVSVLAESAARVEALVDVSGFAALGRQLAESIEMSSVSVLAEVAAESAARVEALVDVSGFAALGRQLAESIEMSSVSVLAEVAAESAARVEALVDVSGFAALGRQLAETIEMSSVYPAVERAFETRLAFDAIVEQFQAYDSDDSDKLEEILPSDNRLLVHVREADGSYCTDVSVIASAALGLLAWVLDAGMNGDLSPVAAAGVFSAVFFWMRRKRP